MKCKENCKLYTFFFWRPYQKQLQINVLSLLAHQMLVFGMVKMIYMMIRKRFITFLCVAAMAIDSSAEGLRMTSVGTEVTSNISHSERSEESVMTLHDCMTYAISNSTKIRIQQAAIGDAQIDRRDAALKLFTPQINAQTYAYYNFGRSIDPQTNTYFNTTSFHNNYGVSAGYDLLTASRR